MYRLRVFFTYVAKTNLGDVFTMSLNKIILIGNIGREADLRYTPQGTPVCNFTLATNEKRRSPSGESDTITTWFRVTLWGKQAESIHRYLQKGKQVYVEGRLRVTEWIDRDNRTRYSLEVTATDLRLLGVRSDDEPEIDNEVEEPTLSGNTSPSNPSNVNTDDDDDIPF